MLGSRGIRGLTALLELSGMSDMPEQCVVSAVLRGNMCRVLAEKLLPSEVDSLSTLGILSTLDVLLTEPMETLIDDLPITPQMRAAILSNAGISGAILKTVVAFDTGDWQSASLEGVTKAELRDAYLASLQRADEVVASLVKK
jgi:EAL and modified HD-GYP domain-containing signal transduction protein